MRAKLITKLLFYFNKFIETFTISFKFLVNYVKTLRPEIQEDQSHRIYIKDNSFLL